MKVTHEEVAAGALSPESLRRALRTFGDVGYVVLEDVYDPEYLKEVREEYEVALDAYLQSRGGLEEMEGKTFGKNHVGFHPPIVPPFSDPRLVAHPIAVQLLTELLGSGYQCGFYNTNTAMPGSGIQPVHRDTGPLFGAQLPVPHPVTTLVLNIPLCDFTLENGCTEVWPGTHLIVDPHPDDGKRLDERAKELPSARPGLPLGSFALRDMRMWHRGMPNTADYPRTMFAIVYSRSFIRTGTLDIPRSTWDSWGETERSIFRNNPIVEDGKGGMDGQDGKGETGGMSEMSGMMKSAMSS